ncbi:MAG: hypothetical protein KatS3mg022_1373 [Armatimonadota bacterium]|nr:MAG: hypothetical protein KatS3mg022_1373 [Armatimonadota bacterium]
MQTSTRAQLDQVLHLLADANEGRAREAWEYLWKVSRPYLLRYLSVWLHNVDDREDVIQDCFLRIWASRDRFRNQGEQAWFAFIRRTAYRCMIDMRRRLVQETLSLDDIEEPEATHIADTADSLAAAMLAKELYLAADLLWLGLDAHVPPRMHHVRLLAAQLYYLHGKSWQEIVHLLLPTGIRLDRSTLDVWLTQPGVLRHLCYHTLYYSNDRLTGYLLQLPEPFTEKQVDEAVRCLLQCATSWTPPPGVSTWEEAWFVAWRYRYGLQPNRMRQRVDCPFSAGEIQGLQERFQQRLPFRQQMAQLLERFEQAGGADLTEVVSSAGLWQRLAFQYCYHDGLAHVDICERMFPAAECAGYHLTMGMLNVWLSNGRLAQRLARFYQQWKGGVSDAE